MEIRRARPEEIPALKALHIASKGYWGYSAEWMAAWVAQLEMTPQYITDHGGEVYVAVADGALAGYVSLVAQGVTCVLDDLWVTPERIRSGVGRRLFAYARARAAELGAARLEWDAEPNAVGFYERMGARQIGETTSRSGRVLPVMAILVAEERAGD